MSETDASALQNVEEIHAIVNLVKKYYKHKEFCIITPYDGQRAAIVAQLKAENLRHDNVYNVDSYQGTSMLSLVFAPHSSPSSYLL